ncbi:unnamed protein product [Cyprideis torosa]|uniref:Calcium-transporting ATPase n=1 Tax=Cyprideis torosa TaxID=163714 RepID=A0A7R8ZS82_9CRUS|nr:unnamed protein product [Cyprideis torosa]CAG0894886.1 unnamed protein product [Cyprideis torosa]
MVPEYLSADQASKLETQQVAAILDSNLQEGLTWNEAERRQHQWGFNELVETSRGPPLWKKYISQFGNPMILLLLCSSCISAFMQHFDDAISISIAILIVVTVGFVQEYKSEKSLQALKKLVPPSCVCIREGKRQRVLARTLVPGDIVVLSVGDWIPADVRLFQVTDITVDESNFTGETEPAHKTSSCLLKGREGLTDATIGFMGTLVRQGHGMGIVLNTARYSKFGEVYHMMRNEESPPTPLQKNMDSLGKQLSLYSFGIIGFILLMGCLQGRELLHMLNIGVSLAVAAIPEGLPIVVTVTLALGVNRMAKREAIVKKLPIVETLGCVDVICSDKTGTLTKNEMTVTWVALANGETVAVEKLQANKFDFLKATSSASDFQRLVEVGAVCNNAVISSIDGSLQGQPTETALIGLAAQIGMENVSEQYKRISEVPFTSERKTMSVQVLRQKDIDESKVTFLKGALENVLGQCRTFLAYDKERLLNEEKFNQFLKEGHDLGQRGLRVLGLAYGSHADFGLTFVGMVGMTDPVREGVLDSIRTLLSAGVDMKMLTGDAIETALAVGMELGLLVSAANCLSGPAVDNMTDEQLADVIDEVTVFYRASPRHKLRIVKALQAKEHVVGMTGDGVNDGVALKKADVGIAMGRMGTDVSKEAADVILVNDDFSTILAAIEEGKSIFYNIQNFVRFQLSTSIAALALVTLSTLVDIPTPLNAMQTLWINIIMDGPPAQSLGVEPVDKDVIRQKPRGVGDPMITRRLIGNVIISSFITVCCTLWVFVWEIADGVVNTRDTTMAFTCFVFFGLFNALACRSQTKSVFEIGLLSNKPFLFAISGSLLGQLAVIYAPPLQKIFQTEALGYRDIIYLTILSTSVFIVSEIKKFIETYYLTRRTSLSGGVSSETDDDEV